MIYRFLRNRRILWIFLDTLSNCMDIVYKPFIFVYRISRSGYINGKLSCTLLYSRETGELFLGFFNIFLNLPVTLKLIF